jgi:hypothetical protein
MACDGGAVSLYNSIELCLSDSDEGNQAGRQAGHGYY